MQLGTPILNWQPPITPKNLHLQGQYCHLEPLQSKHAEALFNANNTPTSSNPRPQQNWTYLPYGPFNTLGAYHHWLQQIERQADPYFLSIFSHNGTHCSASGIASYLRIDAANGCIEIGHLNFSPLLQRSTAASEAIYLMIDWAFQHGYRRVEWKCNALNHRSRLAAQRFGFSYEGIFRQAAVVKARNRDTAWFAIIDQEWQPLQHAYQQFLHPSNFKTGQQQQRLSQLTRPHLQQLDSLPI